ncbi:Uncharacterised protein [Bordetella pertussis]|nr:Uncharacterised protein [Bordetella pertussis]
MPCVRASSSASIRRPASRTPSMQATITWVPGSVAM